MQYHVPPDFLLIDGDDVGFQPDVNEEATGDLFVSNGQNVSDYNEQLSIADPASDGKHLTADHTT